MGGRQERRRLLGPVGPSSRSRSRFVKVAGPAFDFLPLWAQADTCSNDSATLPLEHMRASSSHFPLQFGTENIACSYARLVCHCGSELEAGLDSMTCTLLRPFLRRCWWSTLMEESTFDLAPPPPKLRCFGPSAAPPWPFRLLLYICWLASGDCWCRARMSSSP